jgi:DNA-binding MarR family transcriptional regulator
VVLGESSQAALADGLGIDRSNLTDVVDALSGEGLIERTLDETDRRRYVLRLSAGGRRLLGHTAGAIADAEDELLAPLDAAQREQLYGLLRRLADGIALCPSGETLEAPPRSTRPPLSKE